MDGGKKNKKTKVSKNGKDFGKVCELRTTWMQRMCISICDLSDFKNLRISKILSKVWERNCLEIKLKANQYVIRKVYANKF